MSVKSIDEQGVVISKEIVIENCLGKMKECLTVFRNPSASYEDVQKCQDTKNLVDECIRKIIASKSFPSSKPDFRQKVDKIQVALPRYQEKIDELFSSRKKTDRAAKTVLQPPASNSNVPSVSSSSSSSSSSSTTSQPQQSKIDPFQQKAKALLNDLKAPTMTRKKFEECRQALSELQKDRRATSIKGPLSLCEKAIELRPEIFQLEEDAKKLLYNFLKNREQKEDVNKKDYTNLCTRFTDLNNRLVKSIIPPNSLLFIHERLLDISKLDQKLKDSAAITVSGTFNQFHPFKTETGEDEFVGASLTSPCTLCAGSFLQLVLDPTEGRNRVLKMDASGLDQMVREGKRKYGALCQFLLVQEEAAMNVKDEKKGEVAIDNKGEKPRLKDHFSNILELMAGSGDPRPYDFTGLQRLGDASSDFSTQEFREVLEYVAPMRSSRGADGVSVGCVITAGNRETYAVAFIYNPATKQDEIVFFDSHGVRTGLTPAYMFRFKNINDAAQFLAFRCPYECGRPDETNDEAIQRKERNQVSIVPVVNASVKLGATPVIAPRRQKEEKKERKVNVEQKPKLDGIVGATSICGFYKQGLHIPPRIDQPAMTHADVMKLPHHLLEGYHNYIQWLFPMLQEGAFKAPLLDREAVAFFKTDEGRTKLMQSFDLMLDFYGLKRIVKDKDKVEVVEVDNEKFTKITKHNYLRMSRIMGCLTLLGYTKEAQAFHACLMQDKNKTRFPKISQEEWDKALALRLA